MDRKEKDESTSVDNYVVDQVNRGGDKAREWGSKTIRNSIYGKRKAADHSRSAASFSYSGKKKNYVFVQGLNPHQQMARRKAVRDFQKTRVTAMTTRRMVQNIYRVLSAAVKSVGTAVKGIGALLCRGITLGMAISPGR